MNLYASFARYTRETKMSFRRFPPHSLSDRIAVCVAPAFFALDKALIETTMNVLDQQIFVVEFLITFYSLVFSVRPRGTHAQDVPSAQQVLEPALNLPKDAVQAMLAQPETVNFGEISFAPRPGARARRFTTSTP